MKVLLPCGKNSMACVALIPARSRWRKAALFAKPYFKIEPLLKKYSLESEGIITAMTGCPNGCRSPLRRRDWFGGHGVWAFYNLHFGGDRVGERFK